MNTLEEARESHIYLSGFINSQNMRFLATERPCEAVSVPLHAEKIGVWCAVSFKRVIGPIFFTNMISAQSYLVILAEFAKKVRNLDRSKFFFQQDGAPAHRAKIVKEYLTRNFNGNVIGLGFNITWPPRSPDLTPPDFFLWGSIKGKVYSNNPETIDQLKINIRNEISRIPAETLQNLSKNMEKRVLLCKANNGGYFEHLL